MPVLRPPWPPGAARLLAGAACSALVVLPAVHAERPPIQYRGQIETSYRSNESGDGDRIGQNINSLDVEGITYIWQPWIAQAAGHLNLAYSTGDGGESTDSEFFGGGANLRLFPLSRFPFEAYFDHSSSTSDFSSVLLQNTVDYTTTRYGASQRYRNASGTQDYGARIEHLSQDSANGEQDVSDLVQIEANYYRLHHELRGSLDYARRSNTALFGEQQDLTFTGRHTYRPGNTLAVDTFLSAIDLQRQSPLAAVDRLRTALLTSNAFWSPEDKPLRVTGRGTLGFTETGADPRSYLADLSGTASYDWTPMLRLSGSVGLSASGESLGDISTFQSGSIAYTPPTRPLGNYVYNWATSGFLSNETSPDEDAVQTVGGSAGHGISRAIPFGSSGALALSLSANQSLSVDYDTSEGSSQTLGHGGSVALTHARAQGVIQVSLSATDSRTTGANEQTFQNLVGTATSSLQLSPVSTLAATLGIVVSRIDQEGFDDTIRSSVLGVTYDNARVMGMERLRFSSRLEMSSDALLPFSEGRNEIQQTVWDNRLTYAIGLLSVSVQGTAFRSSGQTDLGVLISVARTFGGVF